MDNEVGLESFADRGRRVGPVEAPAGPLRQVLEEALGALPEPQRVIFVLRDLEAWPTQEIAAQLEEDPAMVRRRLHLARVALEGWLRRPPPGEAAMQLPAACQGVRDRLTEHAEGALPPRARWALRFHLLRCPACRTFQRSLLALPRLAKGLLDLGQTPAPPEATRALEEVLRRIGTQRS